MSEPKIEIQCWICPACFDDHLMENGCKEELSKKDAEIETLKKQVEQCLSLLKYYEKNPFDSRDRISELLKEIGEMK